VIYTTDNGAMKGRFVARWVRSAGSQPERLPMGKVLSAFSVFRAAGPGYSQPGGGLQHEIFSAERLVGLPTLLAGGWPPIFKERLLAKATKLTARTYPGYISMV